MFTRDLGIAGSVLSANDNEGVATRFVGPLLIGTLFNVLLFGICLMQAHTYSRHCDNDAKWIQYMVAWTVCMEATSSAFASFITFDYAVRDFGRPEKVLIRTPEFSAFILTIGICSTTVQSFYAWRVNKLLGKQWLSNIIYVSAVTQMLCVIGVATGDSIVTSFKAFQQFKPVRVIVIIWMVLAPVTDLFIAGLLVLFLRRSRTGFRKTDSVLNRLTLLTVQTGAVTALGALLGLLLFLTLPDFYHLLFILTLPELYGVCLMSSLNARSAWAGDLSGEQTFHWSQQQQTSRGVQITTTTVTHGDAFELAQRNDDEVAMDVRRTTAKLRPESADIKRSESNTSDAKRRPIGDGLSLRSFDGESTEDPAADDVESQQRPHRSNIPVTIVPMRGLDPTHAPYTDRRRDLGWRDML